MTVKHELLQADSRAVELSSKLAAKEGEAVETTKMVDRLNMEMQEIRQTKVMCFSALMTLVVADYYHY
jgi:hypothetical protein